MSLICVNCGKGIGYGHAVSHAKNRVRRIFKPNIQKLKILKDGVSVRVKMCASCIQKLKKEGHIGNLRYISNVSKDAEIKEAMDKATKIEAISKEMKKPASASSDATLKADKKATENKADSMKIEDIVGKK